MEIWLPELLLKRSRVPRGKVGVRAKSPSPKSICPRPFTCDLKSFNRSENRA